MEYTAVINGASIQDWDSFHNEFQNKIGFFEGYGRNLNAWIDCMSDLYTKEEYVGLTKFNLHEGDKLIILVVNVEIWREVRRDIFDSFIECTLAVNAERTNFYLVLK